MIVQLNAESLTGRRELKALVKWLPETSRLVLGSDMHNMTDRKPQLDQAQTMLSRHRVGRFWLAQMEYTGEGILAI